MIESAGFEQISVENDFIKVIILPQIGGKMIGLINKKTGTNFLLESQNRDKKYEPAFHGAPFQNYDTSGFDECFPTVEASFLTTEEGKKISFPDHGELWSKPWSFKKTDDSTLVGFVKGTNLNYTFNKKIYLDGNRVIIDYKVENNDASPLPYIWAAHPLFNIEPGDEIYLTDEIQNVYLYWSNDSKLGSRGDQLEWPFINSVSDFSVIPEKSFGKAVKLFSGKLTMSAWTALHKKNKKESLLISFDTSENPYLGIWLCYGGWPEEISEKQLTVALEPTNCGSDSLSAAAGKNSCGIIEPDSANYWRIEFAVVNEF